MSAKFDKVPSAITDYQFDFSSWLGVDTIASYEITVSGVALVTDPAASNTDTAVTAWFSGGTVNKMAWATCTITTAAGRVEPRTITFTMIDRKPAE